MAEAIINFEQIKGLVLACTDAQKAELLRLLRVAARHTAPAEEGAGRADAALLELVREALKQRFVIEVPSVAVLQRVRPWLRPLVHSAREAAERFLDREFAGCSRQERAAMRWLLVTAAAGWLHESAHPPRVEAMLNALLEPDQLVDAQYPDYRRAGVLRQVWLDYARRTPYKSTG